MVHMKIGRLILTHREDLVLPIRDFYLDSDRTSFLVVAVNPNTVDVKKFAETDSFRLAEFAFPRPDGTVSMKSRNWRVWVEVAKKFPEIDAWVAHDYDFIAKPSDADIMSHVRPDEYAMIGTAFPVRQKGMGNAKIDTYPFPQGWDYWHQTAHPDGLPVDTALFEFYPVFFQGIKTLVGGYGDFAAASRVNMLLLDDERLKTAEILGGEQIPHTVWRVRGVKPVDLRKFYKVNVLLDVLYTPMSDAYDFQHPVKFWPGQPLDKNITKENRMYKLKNFVKRLIRYEDWK